MFNSATPWTAVYQDSLSFTISLSLLRLMSLVLMMPYNHLISLVLCRPLVVLPSIYPSIRVFSNESALRQGGQSIGATALASVLPMNIQAWLPLGWTVWSSCCPRDSQESFPAQFKSFNSWLLSFLYGPTLTSVHSPSIPIKWWDWMPWSSFSECWALSQLFHSPLSLSSRDFLVPLHFLP